MKIKESFTYNHDGEMESAFSDLIQESLNYFDFCLTYLQEKECALFPEYVRKLESLLESLSQKKQTNEDFAIFFNKLTLFSQFPAFYKTALNACLSFARYDFYRPTSLDQKIWIKKNDFLRGRLFPRHHAHKPLLDLMTRDKAIAFVKACVDAYSSQKRIPEHVEDVRNLINMDNAPTIYQESFDSTSFVYDKDVVGMKINKCRWCEVMKELNDPEFCAAVVCYFDFQDATLMNKNFVLTRTQTLMEGKDYCDFVWHDTRIDKKCAHPGKAFWDQVR